MEFFRQEYWSGLPSPSPGDFSDPGIEPRCVSCTARDSLPLSCQGSYFETDIRACKTENTISFLLHKSGYLVTKLCLSTRLLCPWDFPGKNTEASCHFLLQGSYTTQGSNPCFLCLLNWMTSSLLLSHQETLALKCYRRSWLEDQDMTRKVKLRVSRKDSFRCGCHCGWRCSHRS